MELKLHPYLLQLAHPFRISREAHDDQQTLIVSLHHGTHTGYGEATANPYYQSSIAQMSEQINAIKPLIESWDGLDIDWFDQMLQRSELGQLVWQARKEFMWVGIFSCVYNLLLITPTLYMLQVFDRVEFILNFFLFFLFLAF